MRALAHLIAYDGLLSVLGAIVVSTVGYIAALRIALAAAPTLPLFAHRVEPRDS